MTDYSYNVSNIQKMSCSSLEAIGLVALVYFVFYKILKILYFWQRNRTSIAYETILKPYPDDYAVITGASDGIGLEYARQLAQKGYNLMLLSRTEEKLKKVVTEIQKQFTQCKKVEYLAVDFTSTDIYERIEQKLQTLDGPIHILVNNVGTTYPYPEYFANYPEGYNLNLINVNIVSVTAMSEIVLKIWTKQSFCSVDQKRPKGVLINISSMAGLAELPLFSTYSASKAYMNYLSKILLIEYAKDNILVQNVTPNIVETKLAASMHDPTSAVPAKDYVQYALKALGTEQSTNAHPRQKLINNFFLGLKGVLWESFFYKMGLNALLKAREEALKKQ